MSEFSIANLLAASAVGLLVWALFMWRRTSLQLRYLDSSTSYGFMITVDLVLAYKRPTLLVSSLDIGLADVTGRGAMYVFLAAAILTYVGGWLSLLFDDRIEQWGRSTANLAVCADQAPTNRWQAAKRQTELAVWRAASAATHTIVGGSQVSLLLLIQM
jgi:hypothetical protein